MWEELEKEAGGVVVSVVERDSRTTSARTQEKIRIIPLFH